MKVKRFVILSLSILLVSCNESEHQFHSEPIVRATELSYGVYGLNMILGKKVNDYFIDTYYSSSSITEEGVLYYGDDHNILVNSENILIKVTVPVLGDPDLVVPASNNVSYRSSNNSLYDFGVGTKTINLSNNGQTLPEKLQEIGYVEIQDHENYEDVTYSIYDPDKLTTYTYTYEFRVFEYECITLAYAFLKDSEDQNLGGFEFSTSEAL